VGETRTGLLIISHCSCLSVFLPSLSDVFEVLHSKDCLFFSLSFSIVSGITAFLQAEASRCHYDTAFPSTVNLTKIWSITTDCKMDCTSKGATSHTQDRYRSTCET